MPPWEFEREGKVVGLDPNRTAVKLGDGKEKTDADQWPISLAVDIWPFRLHSSHPISDGISFGRDL